MSILDHPPSLFATNENGTPAAKARKSVFHAGTERLRLLYKDEHLRLTIANPLEADENGQFPNVYLPDGEYDIRVEDAAGRVLAEYQNVATTSDQVPFETVADIFTNNKIFGAIQSVSHLKLDDLMSYQVLPGKFLANVGEVLEFPLIGCFYEVMDAAAQNHHIVNANGVKFRAVPGLDRELRTSHLGWEDGEDVTERLRSLLDNADPRMAVLRFDGSYAFRGSRYEIPETIEAFLSDNYELLAHGESASRSLLAMDASHESAAANGVPIDLTRVFDVPSGFKVGGLRFDHNVQINEFDLQSGGNKSEWFRCENREVGIHIDKCRFDFAGGTAVEVQASPNWQFTDNFAGKQKYLLQLTGAAHYGVYKGNRGRMGLRSLNGNGSGLQSFGDYIKTNSLDNVGPRYCKIENNIFINDHRDGPDGTGGFHGWIFEGNYFEVAIAGIDVKLAFRTTGDFEEEEALYRGMIIRNNTFVGCGLVYTSTWVEAALGEPMNEDLMLRGILSDGNLFLPKVGKGAYGHYSKSTHRITSVNDQFMAIKTKPAGTWNPNTGQFPENAVYGTHYEVSANGTFAGVNFVTGGLLRPRVADASLSTYTDNWDYTNSGNPWLGIIPLRVDDTGSAGQFPKNLVFKGMRWDARGAGVLNLSECKEISLDFAEYLTDGSGNITINADDIKISGNIRGVARPVGQNGVADAFVLGHCSDVMFDVDFRHTDTDSRGGLFRVVGSVQNIWVDGYIGGCLELADVANTGVISGLLLGKRSGLEIGSGLVRVLSVAGSATDVLCGEVALNGTLAFNNAPTNHNLGKLQGGLGTVLEIQNGSVDATHGVHRIDTEGQAATDSLNTISGGALGDRMTIASVDSGRSISVETGSGNLVLPTNRTLGTTSATLVLEKMGDDQWHEVNYVSV